MSDRAEPAGRPADPGRPARILLVDDEENVLNAYTRVLRRRFVLETALGGAQALEFLARGGTWAVVVSDQRMPGMDGTELLSRIKELSPDTTRIMLTGNADQATAMEAVNRGAIFRFLTKPCEPDLLAATIEAGIRQHELVTAEKDLLERTLKGSLAMVVELLSVIDPISFGRAQSMAALAEGVARDLGMASPWILGIASILSQIGTLTVPGSLVTKIHTGGFLNSGEREIANRIPEIGSNLLRHIPRLEQVAEAVLYMGKNFNGTGFPADPLRGDEIPLGGRVLRVANDYLNLLGNRKEPGAALAEMECRAAWYDLEVVRSLSRVVKAMEPAGDELHRLDVGLKELRIGQVLETGIETAAGLLLVPAGTRLGLTHLEKLRNFARLGDIREPITVLTPLE
jgi:response regulator RpfG family c-di-GMP phosphodiesterase